MLEMARVLPLAQIAEAICKNSLWCDHCCMFTVEYRHHIDQLACPLCKWSVLYTVDDARMQQLFISEERAAELAAGAEEGASDPVPAAAVSPADLRDKVRALLRRKMARQLISAANSTEELAAAEQTVAQMARDAAKARGT